MPRLTTYDAALSLLADKLFWDDPFVRDRPGFFTAEEAQAIARERAEAAVTARMAEMRATEETTS